MNKFNIFVKCDAVPKFTKILSHRNLEPCGILDISHGISYIYPSKNIEVWLQWDRNNYNIQHVCSTVILQWI